VTASKLAAQLPKQHRALGDNGRCVGMVSRFSWRAETNASSPKASDEALDRAADGLAHAVIRTKAAVDGPFDHEASSARFISRNLLESRSRRSRGAPPRSTSVRHSLGSPRYSVRGPAGFVGWATGKASKMRSILVSVKPSAIREDSDEAEGEESLREREDRSCPSRRATPTRGGE